MTNKKEKEIKEKPEDIIEAEAAEKDEESKNAKDENVTIPLKDYADQLEELDDLRQKVDEFSDGWQRERAEFSNYRKRIERDREMEKQNSKIDVIKKYLALHDDFERALKNIPQESVQGSWMEGLKLIEQKMKNLLDGEGIAAIPAENIAFDPNLHEAITHEENPDFESGQIIEVVQQGYTIGDRVIRPALVRVAK